MSYFLSFSFLSFASFVWQSYAYYTCTLVLSGVYWQNFFFSFLLHLCSWEQVKLSSSLVYLCIFQFVSLLLTFFFFFFTFSIAFLFVCHVE